jgi:hypothetical protein
MGPVESRCVRTDCCHSSAGCRMERQFPRELGWLAKGLGRCIARCTRVRATSRVRKHSRNCRQAASLESSTRLRSTKVRACVSRVMIFDLPSRRSRIRSTRRFLAICIILGPNAETEKRRPHRGRLLKKHYRSPLTSASRQRAVRASRHPLRTSGCHRPSFP